MNNSRLQDFLDLMLLPSVKDNFVNQVKHTLENKGTKQHPIRLTAAKLREIRWMTASQIATIYQYGKIPFVIDDSPEAYRELRWMDQEQLEALFGKSEDSNE